MAQDKDLKLVMELVKSGWPQKRQGVLLVAHPFYAVKMNKAFRVGCYSRVNVLLCPHTYRERCYNFCTHLISAWKVVFTEVESQFSDQE